METKTCSRCKQAKPFIEFYHRKPGNTLHSACKVCERAMAKDWYERNREKAKSKYQEWRAKNTEAVRQYRADNRRKAYQQEVRRKYGVDAGWFEKQMLHQGGKCNGCGALFAWGDKLTTPHVDHCHTTQAVRGLLCNRCNSVLGLCEDSPKLLAKLERYLRRCHGTSVEN
jgi:hypothetical protein